MLKVFFFYIFIWWFKKSDNKKELIVRSALAAVIGAFCFIAGIFMFTGTSTVPEKDSWGFIFGGIVYLVLAVLFLIRTFLDVKKIKRKTADVAEGRRKIEERQKKIDEEKRQREIARSEEIKKENEARKKLEAEQAQRQKEERDTATCKDLLEQCGMQFFIEYYPQLKRLPIPDITLSDHFSGEREVRLPPAKKIIDSGLAECALHYIIETYGDIFSGEVIGRAQSILEEIKNEKAEENQNENNERE